MAAALALAFNALVWGLSWWPFRQLQDAGWHPLVSTAIIYGGCALAVIAWRPSTLRELARTPALAVLMLASGLTNAAFNWAVTVGDVVRVVLLFYLMPIWAVLLARGLLGEPITPQALMRVALAVAGAAIVLQAGSTPSLPASPASLALAPHASQASVVPPGLVDALAVAGGFAFALNNVMLRRLAWCSAPSRTLAMFVGGAVVASAVATLVRGWPSLPVSTSPAELAPSATSLGLIGLLAAAFLLANVALQYGASRLTAQATAVIMLLEVVFAGVSALLLGASTADVRLWLGGALILGAALLAARSELPSSAARHPDGL
jgi:drug/metabolite transporter (DMT)-like permease